MTLSGTVIPPVPITPSAARSPRPSTPYSLLPMPHPLPLDSPATCALNYCSCSQIVNSPLSTPSSPVTPPSSFRKPPAVSSASSTTSAKSPGATIPRPTATTDSEPPGFSTIEASAKSPGTPLALRHPYRNETRNQRNPIITRIKVQTTPALRLGRV